MRQLSRRVWRSAGAALGFVGSERGFGRCERGGGSDRPIHGAGTGKGKVSIEAARRQHAPLSVTVDAPMANDKYYILVVADGNPNPGVATFHFSPMSGSVAPCAH